MTQFQTRLDIAILPPYTPSPAERADPKLYAANVRALYGRAMGLPLVEQARPCPAVKRVGSREVGDRAMCAWNAVVAVGLSLVEQARPRPVVGRRSRALCADGSLFEAMGFTPGELLTSFPCCID